jgi:alkylation response protein AidB-like acyl-CoA dehydrogenase
MTTHYLTNLRDIEFNLYDVHKTNEYLGTEPFGEIDETTARDILREIDRLAREDFAASFVDGDRVGLRLEDGEVKIPQSIKDSLDALYDGGWGHFLLSPALGGVGAPPSLRWAVQELLVGANPAAYFYVSGALMSEVLGATATPEQIETWAKPMVERQWGGTMVLTEADAGSDVGAGLTKAFHVEDDLYHLEGVKRFITSGDNDYFENILHLVLARPEGAGPGTKGLSMFIVPKYLLDEDGSIGERNGVDITVLEDKMGIKASSTVEMTLGQTKPCHGYLVGNVHDGIRQMFLVIEEARMLIGAKSMATLSTAYLNALEYAKERIQGADITDIRDPEAPRVAIIRHPDVRRMLMEQKAHAEGMRALLYYTASLLDEVKLAEDTEAAEKMANLLLPLVKGYSSEKAYVLLGQCLQVLGGNGYVKDYPMEQYIRDIKIDSIYEGTTGIQAMDLFFRQIARDRGETFWKLAGEIMETVKGGAGDDALAEERELLGVAADDVGNHLRPLFGYLIGAQVEPEHVYKVALHTNSFLDSVAELVIGWQLIRHAEVALQALPEATGPEEAFLQGKVAAARWFAKNVLPLAAVRRATAERERADLMTLPDEAF